MRHTYVSYLRQDGVALDLISKLLGHKDLRMTERYAHLSLDPLKEAVKALDNSVYRGESDGICYKSATVGHEKRGHAERNPLISLAVPTGVEPVS